MKLFNCYYQNKDKKQNKIRVSPIVLTEFIIKNTLLVLENEVEKDDVVKVIDLINQYKEWLTAGNLELLIFRAVSNDMERVLTSFLMSSL
jgi:hypothetical protein